MARTYFLWDPVEDNIIEEYDEAGNTIADYTTEPYLYGDLISQHRDGQSRFYCFDILGSTLALTDSSGNVTDTTSYTAFGEVTERTGSTVNAAQYLGRSGYSRSDAIGEYLVRNRRLLTNNSRWLSLYIAGDPFPPHYSYVSNKPTFHSDPSGMFEGIIPRNGTICPPNCDCKLDEATFLPCGRGLVDFPITPYPTKTPYVPGKPERFFRSLHIPKSFNQTCDYEVRGTCCQYDLKISLGFYRCERRDGPTKITPNDPFGYIQCGPMVSRGDPWNFALASLVRVEKTNDTCGKPDEGHYQWCPLVIGIHEHTFTDCTGLGGGTEFEPTDWCDADRVVDELCELITLLPISEKIAGNCPKLKHERIDLDKPFCCRYAVPGE